MAAALYACDRCGSADAGGYTVKQMCAAFEQATAGEITAAHVWQAWTETLGEAQRPGQPQLAHLSACPHTICIKCALETTYGAEERTCPVCRKYSYLLAAFVDLMLKNDPLLVDEKAQELAASMRRIALAEVDHAGESFDEEDAERQMQEIDQEAKRQTNVAKKYIQAHQHVRALIASAAAADMFIQEDMCRYRDGLLELYFELDNFADADNLDDECTPCVEVHVLPYNKHVCKIYKLMHERTRVPQWALNVMEVENDKA